MRFTQFTVISLVLSGARRNRPRKSSLRLKRSLLRRPRPIRTRKRSLLRRPRPTRTRKRNHLRRPRPIRTISRLRSRTRCPTTKLLSTSTSLPPWLAATFPTSRRSTINSPHTVSGTTIAITATCSCRRKRTTFLTRTATGSTPITGSPGCRATRSVGPPITTADGSGETVGCGALT